jgi:hypothetical protein
MANMSIEWYQEIERKVRQSENRLWQIEQHVHIHYPHNEAAMKEAAAKQQALSQYPLGVSPGNPDRVPMRSDVEAILTMTAFCKRLLDTHDLAYAVTLEVRNEARRALALKEREV